MLTHEVSQQLNFSCKLCSRLADSAEERHCTVRVATVKTVTHFVHVSYTAY